MSFTYFCNELLYYIKTIFYQIQTPYQIFETEKNSILNNKQPKYKFLKFLSGFNSQKYINRQIQSRLQNLIYQFYHTYTSIKIYTVLTLIIQNKYSSRNFMNDSDKPQLFSDECEMVGGSTLLSTLFYLKQDQTQPAVLVLTNKYVFFHSPDNRQKRKGFIITFDTIFQVLKTKPKTDEKTNAKYYGIKFMCQGMKPKQFYNENNKQLDKWEAELKKCMNQFNFHDIFKAEKKLGKGNFATVYLGSHSKQQRKFAIKAFGKQAAYSQENGKQAIINEVKITRMFNHPNLMKMEGVYQSQNSLYFALQYVEGTPICNRVTTLNKYTQAQRRSIMKGVLRGLSEMARKNVIHRDLKPQNIIVGKEPIIIDFGLATIADEPKYLFVRCGTPGYVAPQIINIKDMSTKSHPISDVFSVGCIFYYMIFSRHLFTGKSGQEIIRLNRQCDLVLSGPDFDKLNPKEADLLRKMLQKEPQLRISAAQALRQPYFTDAEDKLYIPKIIMKQSGSCPMDLISNQNEAAVKFITSDSKAEKKQPFVRSYDRASIKRKIEALDINKLLINI